MPVMDEFREEREALKNGTLKQKFNYFLDYYKWYVVVAVLILIFAGSLIYQTVTRKERGIYCVLLNAYGTEQSDEYPLLFGEYAGIDPDTYDIIFDNSMFLNSSDIASYDENTVATTQKLMVLIAARELDTLTASESTINSYAYNDTFYDLSALLTKDQYEKYEPYFYYMDRAVLREMEEMEVGSDDYVSIPDYPSPRNPESMEEPVPVGIYLDEAPGIKEHYLFTDETVIVTVLANTEHTENAVKYIDFLFQ